MSTDTTRSAQTASIQTSASTGTSIPPAVHLHHLSKSFGSLKAVDDLDLSIRPGEVVAFLGPNGAGKTTTIDMLLGLSRPDEGTVEIFGQPPRRAVSRGLVSSVMQTGGLLDDLTVRETVEYTSAVFASSLDVDLVLERAGISGIADSMVKKCSGGQKQRLRFAMALLPDPALIVLDEPTTGMDVTGRRDFWHEMRADALHGKTILFATHYLEEADEFADRVVLVANGQIVADGPSHEIRAMAAAKTVSATLPRIDAASPTEADAENRLLDHLGGLAGVESVDVQGRRLKMRTTDSDTAAKTLFDSACTDLEITSHSLEDAFISLTSNNSPSDQLTSKGA
ncbi:MULTISPECIES: ABC transporter ATP-binding protein [unclassified Brevibacterium]|uniref:ABC transporter ATP-binding protein n=1 Tax=unclassified Brevibacterium TaxID=2614124 RepID=UPI001E2F59A0|nr:MULTISPECIES: ABC transporter ATP-binding protein [unclassified Brevibacterium]MCD1286862.1 ABC transporter ATP-binding protein [Brevibacterium sp. CCUG 69071]MDK8433901.1 ABC transporter ATP-binding protein [Brevibacterium sp. H-BE7]